MASQALASAALEIEHAATGKKVQFLQIKMTGFSDTVTPSWTEESVYGRMDPIATYQGTTRAIELSFDIGPFSDSDDRKKLALQKVSRLMQFQYPTYTTSGSATSITSPPILNVQFANYIRSGNNGPLLCYMTAMSYTPVDGMSATTTPKVVDDRGATILPQRIAVSLSLKVLHGEPPGWSANTKEWDGGNYWGPYFTSGSIGLADVPTGPTGIEAQDEADADTLK
tara:strand:- start:59 stop:736 length:678 start_codon:yes stop_codon:yes gene_type:complete